MRPIPEFETEYDITEEGNVIRRETGKILRPSLNKQNGYLYVGLWKANKGRTYSVHRLVASTFIPNPQNKPFINHKDSNRANSHKNNLEWVTQSENLLHGYEFGHMSQEARRNFKEFELDILLKGFLSGLSMTALAQEYKCGLSRLTINLRKHAQFVDLINDFEKELYQQKRLRNAQANAHKRKAIIQSDLSGAFITQHESATSAAKALGKKSSGSISNALNPNHPQKKAFGYLWKYA